MLGVIISSRFMVMGALKVSCVGRECQVREEIKLVSHGECLSSVFFSLPIICSNYTNQAS